MSRLHPIGPAPASEPHLASEARLGQRQSAALTEIKALLAIRRRIARMPGLKPTCGDSAPSSVPSITEPELRRRVVLALQQVAPEIVAVKLDPTLAMRDQLEIDSIDFLNFVIGLESAVGIEIPDSDQLRLSSLDGAVSYLMARAASQSKRGVR
jgi:acyl carrier protein